MLQEGLGVRSGYLDLAEGRAVEDRRRLVGGHDLAADGLEPVGPAEGQIRFIRLPEPERAFPAVDLARLRARRPMFGVERQAAQVARRRRLNAGKGNLVMPAEHLRRPGHQMFDAVELRREAVGPGLRQVAGGMAVDDGVGQVHAGATAAGDADRIHTAAEEQAAGLRGLAEHEHAVRRKALRAVEQHPHFGGFQRRQPVQRVLHHRLEVVPVLGQQAEFEGLVQHAGRDRFAMGSKQPTSRPPLSSRM